MAASGEFDRRFFAGENRLTRIGGGAIGGKAAGLAGAAQVLAREFGGERYPGLTVAIPRSTVIGTAWFDAFVDGNRLRETALAGLPDARVAHEFQRASLPAGLVGDLRALAEEAHAPLAVRSSSLLEDALGHPFAGVYATKMIANNQPTADERFRRLVEAVKFVWASAFSADARRYLESVGREPGEERMAVLIQEIVGRRYGDRFYPAISGVARSHNSYPSGHAEPGDGVVELAVGLGKTIVEGGLAWSYSPAYPATPRPFNGIADMMKHTQVDFWAVNMGRPPAWDPLRETEYLVRGRLADAEADGSLRFAASTYSAESDRLVPGTGPDGPRVVTFAPLLDGDELNLNALIRDVLAACKAQAGADVEVEFAVDLDPARGLPARLGFLQVRPMGVAAGALDLAPERLDDPGVVVASTRALGGGERTDLADVVYLRPEAFEPKSTPLVAAEVEQINAALVAERRPYLLIGFGRWGTTDPWRGVPVTWSQISGARAIVEVDRAGMETEPSQGSHFFHNVAAFGVLYFSVAGREPDRVAWDWLERQPLVRETRFVRHVRPAAPVGARVDGRRRIGIVSSHEH